MPFISPKSFANCPFIGGTPICFFKKFFISSPLYRYHFLSFSDETFPSYWPIGKLEQLKADESLVAQASWNIRLDTCFHLSTNEAADL